MSYSIDKDKAYKAAKDGLKFIENYRAKQLEEAINEEVANSEKWHRRIPFLFKKINREEALNRVKHGQGTFSTYAMIQITYGRYEDAVLNVLKACENTSENTVHIGDEDFRYLRF